MAAYLPQDWPEAVRPPGSEDFEASAVAWLLDVLTADFRRHLVVRRYPAGVDGAVPRAGLRGGRAAGLPDGPLRARGVDSAARRGRRSGRVPNGRAPCHPATMQAALMTDNTGALAVKFPRWHIWRSRPVPAGRQAGMSPSRAAPAPTHARREPTPALLSLTSDPASRPRRTPTRSPAGNPPIRRPFVDYDRFVITHATALLANGSDIASRATCQTPRPSPAMTPRGHSPNSLSRPRHPGHHSSFPRRPGRLPSGRGSKGSGEVPTVLAGRFPSGPAQPLRQPTSPIPFQAEARMNAARIWKLVTAGFIAAGLSVAAPAESQALTPASAHSSVGSRSTGAASLPTVTPGEDKAALATRPECKLPK
jgi:hypothetical protein